MKSILYGIGTMNIGGTEKHLVNILNDISKTKYKISLFLLYKNGPYLSHIPKNIKIYSIPKILENSGKISVIFQIIRLFILLITRKYDLLHFYLPHMYIVGGLFAWLMKKKFVMSRRSLNNYQSKNKLFRIIEPFLHQKTNLILVNSNAIMQELINEENVEKEKIRLIYNGVQSVKKIKKKKSKIIKLVCVANFIKYKRHEDLIKSCSLISEKNWILNLIGKGSKKRIYELKTIINTLKLNSKIKFYLDVNNPSRFLEDSDIGLLCSEEEGFSNSILEYMSYGLPVVASNVGGNKESVEHGKNGFLFRVGKIEKIHTFISKLLTDSNLRKEMGNNSLKIQKKNYTLKKQIVNYELVYDELLKA